MESKKGFSSTTVLSFFRDTPVHADDPICCLQPTAKLLLDTCSGMEGQAGWGPKVGIVPQNNSE